MTTSVHAGDLLEPAARLRLTIVLGLLTTLGPFTIDLYVPAFPAMAMSLGTTASAVQATLAGTTIGFALGQPLIGPLSDRVGRRVPLIIATLMHVVASLACAFAPDVVALTALRFLMGAAAAGSGVVAAAMVRDLYRGVPMMRLSARLGMINGVAPIVAPLIGALLLQWVDWRGIFWALAGFGAAVVIATIAAVPETLEVEHRTNGGFRELRDTASTVLRDRAFVGFGVIGGFVWASQFAVIAGSPFYFQDAVGFNVVQYGGYYAVLALGFVGGAQASARLAHRISPDRQLVAATAAMTVGGATSIIAALGGSPLALAIALWLSVVGAGVAVPCSRALSMNRVARRGAGTAAAILGAGSFLLAGLVSPLAGAAPNLPAVAMGIVMAGCSVVAVVLAVGVRRVGAGWDEPSLPGASGGST